MKSINATLCAIILTSINYVIAENDPFAHEQMPIDAKAAGMASTNYVLGSTMTVAKNVETPEGVTMPNASTPITPEGDSSEDDTE
ncbi:Uncharacterised protein [BD1-7 clade bacterium]|uniref:Uncharacterized protein n=1 Tax=BD1-7 clade bacterium TaxID=2029982 RepID=A0A5S9P6W5_9GAMM|nr:Uncharacterised protein [BD1-7 clade bacterium]CAA0099139.1 Uncharacterised protein [BD1-7 clade bacterium]